MLDILHRVGINAPIEKVYEALTAQAGISSWWTRKVKILREVGAIMEVHFNNDSLVMKIRIEHLGPPSVVRWRVLTGPPEWIGTTINFVLKPNGSETVVPFTHRQWK